jgi:hypothetical protein
MASSIFLATWLMSSEISASTCSIRCCVDPRASSA